MTPRERRALRAIEEALAAEDPALARRMREPPVRWRARLRRKLMWMAASIAVILLLGGLFLSVPGLFFGAVLMLIVLWLIHRWASAPPAGDT
ncbi:DUF3040 domain-containing protein [Pseudonocardia aurantiaca]|uniref:DUF3040 domain-containing protein n=1 Tax=Pseudonocardia aurantiaca TaxID=75290 RepID=A0ABW4FM60_9PSEU